MSQRKYGVPPQFQNKNSWGKMPYKDIRDEHLRDIQTKIWNKFSNGKSHIDGKNIYLAISEVFKDLDQQLPTAEQVIDLLIEYDDNESLQMEQKHFHSIIRDIAGLTDTGKKRYK